MQNYDKVKNVEEFAHLGGIYHNQLSADYSRTCMAYLYTNGFWTKNREGILNDLQHTKQRISTISTRYGFDSLSHFAHFCKDSFGDTPRALRKRTANGENITIICKEHNKEQEDE